MLRFANLRGLSCVAAAIFAAACQTTAHDSPDVAHPKAGQFVEVQIIKESSFAPSWLPLIAYATAHLEQKQIDDGCYEIKLDTDGEQRTVILSQILVTKETSTSGDFVIVGKEGCARSFGFNFDHYGKFTGMQEWRD